MPYQMTDGRWRAHRMIAGKRKTKICATKAQAKAWEAEQSQQNWQEQDVEQTPTACLHDIATLYLDFSQSRHDKKTFDAKKLALRRLFTAVSAALEPEELTMKIVLATLAGTAKKISNAAANKDRKHLSAYWEFGKKYHGFPPLNPFQQVERFPEKPENHYVPPVDDFWKVYAIADQKDRAMLLALLHTAGRRSEVLQLTWADVDFHQRKIRLSTCKTRDGSRKRVWLSMTRTLHDTLTAHKTQSSGTSGHVFTSKKTGEPYTTRKHFVEKLCARAGVKPFGYHGIRGLSATLLAQDLPVQEIQGILRHANLTTTARYVRSLGITSDRLSEAFDKKGMAPGIEIPEATK